jgi:hypothetical protein
MFIFAPILATLATLASVVANANLNIAHEHRSLNLYGYRHCHFYLLCCLLSGSLRQERHM